MSNPVLRLFGSNKDTRYQDATAQALPVYEDRDTGRSITVSLTTSFQDFPHRLGRKLTGFTVEQNLSNLPLASEPARNPALFIRLRSTAGTGDVTLRVY